MHSLSPIAHEPTALSPIDRFKLDPVGNSLAVIVLLSMLAAVAYTVVNGRQMLQQPSQRLKPGAPSSREWLVPLLALASLGVAGYLAYVETLEVAAICGPVGDCNTVQQSEYARLFGVLPVGLLGLVGYVGVLAMWLWQRVDSSSRSDAVAALVLFGIAGFGTLFSIYLTFLEAVCHRRHVRLVSDLSGDHHRAPVADGPPRSAGDPGPVDAEPKTQVGNVVVPSVFFVANYMQKIVYSSASRSL